jgi:hypothetical protein
VQNPSSHHHHHWVESLWFCRCHKTFKEWTNWKWIRLIDQLRNTGMQILMHKRSSSAQIYLTSTASKNGGVSQLTDLCNGIVSIVYIRVVEECANERNFSMELNEVKWTKHVHVQAKQNKPSKQVEWAHKGCEPVVFFQQFFLVFMEQKFPIGNIQIFQTPMDKYTQKNCNKFYRVNNYITGSLACHIYILALME